MASRYLNVVPFNQDVRTVRKSYARSVTSEMNKILIESDMNSVRIKKSIGTRFFLCRES